MPPEEHVLPTVAIITGASSGSGAANALRLVWEGLSGVLVAPALVRLEPVAEHTHFTKIQPAIDRL